MKTTKVRIYAVADIHGKPERIDRIRDQVRALKPDVLVAAGDITHYHQAGRVLSRFNRLPVLVLAVRGNSDLPHVEKLFHRFANISPLHLQPVDIRGIRFVGVSGTVLLPFRSRIRYRERHLIKRLAPLFDKRTVLVAHPPPLGVRDEVLGRFHGGSRGVFTLLSTHRPALVLCGHIHERAGWTTVGKTVVVNCAMGKNSAGAVIDIENGQVEYVEML